MNRLLLQFVQTSRVFLLLALTATSNSWAQDLPVISAPLEVSQQGSLFQLTSDTYISHAAGLEAEALYLAASI